MESRKRLHNKELVLSISTNLNTILRLTREWNWRSERDFCRSMLICKIFRRSPCARVVGYRSNCYCKRPFSGDQVTILVGVYLFDARWSEDAQAKLMEEQPHLVNQSEERAVLARQFNTSCSIWLQKINHEKICILARGEDIFLFVL